MLLGRRVAAAFGVSAPYFSVARVAGAAVVVVPHPSGVNHWYNEPENVARMRRFMRALVRGSLEAV